MEQDININNSILSRPSVKFEEYSEEAQEVISLKSSFFEKWALVVFLFLLLTILFGTWFIKYPDVLSASAVLTASNAPKEIIPNQSGMLIGLCVKNNQLVKQGDILGWVESNSDINEVVDLSRRLESAATILENGNPDSIAVMFEKRFNKLGDIQTDYQTFFSAWRQYIDYMADGFFAKKREMLLSDIVSLGNIKRKASLQQGLTNQDNSLARMTFEMNEKLFNEKVISAEEFRRAQSDLINKKIVEPQMDISIISQENQIREKQKEINQLDHDINQQKNIFGQELETFRSRVSDWIRKYAIHAPAEGIVTFALPIQNDQYVWQGRLIGYITPVNSKYYAEVKLPQSNFGKIDTGMKVQLRFDAYPYQEMGFLQGTLNYISNVAVDSGFLATARLDQELTTNRNKIIQFKNGLKANALIITRDIRLFDRIRYTLLKGILTSQ